MEFQPVLGLLVLALGAMAIAAGVIAIADFPADRTSKDLSTQRLCTAALDGAHSLAMAGQEVRGVFLAIGRSILAEDVSQF